MTRHFRNFLFFVLGFLLSAFALFANAGYALMKPPEGLVFSSPNFTYKPPVGVSAANGAWDSLGRVRLNGKDIDLPSRIAPAANVGQFAKSMLRGYPAFFVGTALFSVLLDYGFEYVSDSDQFLIRTSSASDEFLAGPSYWVSLRACAQVQFQCSLQQAIDAAIEYHRDNGLHDSSVYSVSEYHYVVQSFYGSSLREISIYGESASACPAGYNLSNGLCVPVSTYRPATAQDWVDVPVGPLTNTQLDELARYSPEPLPVQRPVIDPVTVPSGQPYTDPVSGHRYQDVARIVSDPTSSSPFRVRIDEYKQPLDDSSPNPDLGEIGVPHPTESPESLPPSIPLFCDWAEVICDFLDWFKESADLPEEVDMPELDIDSPSMQSFGLPDSAACPSPLVLNLGFGSFSISYEPFCNFATSIRPLVLAASYLFAAFIILGVRR